MRVLVLSGFRFSVDGITDTWFARGSEQEVPDAQIPGLVAAGLIEAPREAMRHNPTWPAQYQRMVAQPVRETRHQNHRRNR